MSIFDDILSHTIAEFESTLDTSINSTNRYFIETTAMIVHGIYSELDSLKLKHGLTDKDLEGIALQVNLLMKLPSSVIKYAAKDRP